MFPEWAITHLGVGLALSSQTVRSLLRAPGSFSTHKSDLSLATITLLLYEVHWVYFQQKIGHSTKGILGESSKPCQRIHCQGNHHTAKIFYLFSSPSPSTFLACANTTLCDPRVPNAAWRIVVRQLVAAPLTLKSWGNFGRTRSAWHRPRWCRCPGGKVIKLFTVVIYGFWY